jgi:esterase/lipase superfamily enzyme
VNPNDWLAAVRSEITSSGQVMIFIHGYANPWTGVVGPKSSKEDGDITLVEMVQHFKDQDFTSTPYDGPIILFDWPSEGLYGHAKKVATETANKSFGSLRGIIKDLRKVPDISINVVCHSMGNFLMQQGARFLDLQSIDECLINAAAIADDSFSSDIGKTPTPAIAILHVCKRVTIYYSKHDNALPVGHVFDKWEELGMVGPYRKQPLFPNLYGVDCSQVVKKDSQPMPHTAYYYIQQVLEDFIAVLAGKSQKDLPNRKPTPSGMPGTSFEMIPKLDFTPNCEEEPAQ